MKHKLAVFFKRNATYLIIAFCVLAIGLSVTFALISTKKGVNETANNEQDLLYDINGDDVYGGNEEKYNEKEDTKVDADPVDQRIIFASPVSSYSFFSGYTDTLHYNSTLRRYESHKAIDFYAEEGTPVYAAYDGTVESVTNDLLKGYTITIDHGNGLKTVYNSLLDGDGVTLNQKVKKGDLIGEVSLSNRQEYKEGAHLHFAVIENGNMIDPEIYLLMQDK